MEQKKYNRAQIRKKIREAHPEVIREFDRIHGRFSADHDEKLCEFLDEPSTLKLLEEILEKEMDTSLNGIIDGSMAKYDFVDFSNADLRKKIRDVIKRIRKEAPSVEARIRLQLKLLDYFGCTNLDSFYGKEKIKNILEGVAKDFMKIFSEADEPTRRFLFEACTEYVNRFDTLTEESQQIQWVLWECYAKYYPEDIKKYINRRVEKISSSQELSKGEKHYYVSIYVESMLNIMVGENATEDQLLDYAKKFWEIKEIRQWFINYYRREGHLDKAISLLEESIGMDQEYPLLIENYKSYQAELKELYRKGLK